MKYFIFFLFLNIHFIVSQEEYSYASVFQYSYDGEFFIDESKNQYLIVDTVYSNIEFKTDFNNVHLKEGISLEDFSDTKEDYKFKYYLYSYYKISLEIEEDIFIKCDLSLDRKDVFTSINFSEFDNLIDFKCDNDYYLIENIDFKIDFELTLNKKSNQLYIFLDCNLSPKQEEIKPQSYYFNKTLELIVLKLDKGFYVIN